ncbi:hypothetical protein ABOM_004321 [Aspergillus bombycis]|uniref:C6 finger domain protein n=1 Tax=Aspergillus bombycis TaxID=109264 RepID=A0A1F8A7K0_9EURO|nr:hypothetical protein ABOM_004321 [Aspergillus bombycis]OGM47712.1 hypothetical protein ABOM_004321 [Aspergillus bombycis]
MSSMCQGRLHMFSVRSDGSRQAEIYRSKEQPDHDPWSKITVSLEQQALHFFSYHYLVNGSGRPPSHPDCLAIVYTRATGHGYLANLITAVGLVSLAYLRHAPALTHAARQTYSRALHDVCAALADPAEAASDQMLVAVMLLVLYETVTANSSNDLSPWDRHVDGALALVQLRGVGQLRNRIGRNIFLNLRTEILINCLQRRVRVPITLMNWMSEARHFETAQEAPAGSLADLIVSTCAVLTSVKEEVLDEVDLSRYISTLLSIDQDLKCWAESLPTDYLYKTLTITKSSRELYLGRYDTYSGVEIVHIWNLQRCARITLHQALLEMLSIHFNKGFSPSAPLSSSHVLGTSDAVIRENSGDICHSVPYILHLCDKPGKPGDVRGASIMSLLWPLCIAGTAHTASDTLRDWIIAQMNKIEQVTGIQGAKLVALDIQKRCLFPD